MATPLRIKEASFHFTWVSTDVCVCVLPLCELHHGEVMLEPRVLSVAAFVFRLLTKCSRGKRNTGCPPWSDHL